MASNTVQLNTWSSRDSYRLQNDPRMEYGWNGLNYFNIHAARSDTAKVNDTPVATADWWHILRFNHGNAAGYYTDLAIPFQQNHLFWKRISNGSIQNSSTNSGWIRVLDALNYNSYSPTLTGGGASGTWGINVTGYSKSINPAGTSGQFWRGDNTWSNTLQGDFYVTKANPQIILKATDTASFSILRLFQNNGDSGANIFLNGNTRTSDGGANLLTIRNDIGDLRLDDNVLNTGRLTVGSSFQTTYKMQVDGTSRFTDIVRVGSTVNKNELRIFGKFDASGTGIQDGNDRPSLVVCGNYPQIVLMGGGANNVNHGATISLAAWDGATSTSGTFKSWTFGIPGYNATWLDIGCGTSTNPHVNGIVGPTYGTTVMHLQNDGKVGIGTRAPDTLLHVNGDVKGERFQGALYCPRVNQGNSRTLPGRWKMDIKEYSNDSSNLPSTAWYYIFSMQGDDTGYGAQLALGMTADGAYYRIYNNQSWGSWHSIINTDTNTWRGIQNNLTSSSTTDSLSANQGRLLANGSARDSTKLPLAGGTMTGTIALSFKSFSAMGSGEIPYGNIPDIMNYIRYSSGAMGSFNITTGYSTTAGGSITGGWYNYIYAPHRNGGSNGNGNGDNHLYGMMILGGMTSSLGLWYIRETNGSLAESRRIWMAGNSVTNAVWNDLAECRKSSLREAGYAITPAGSRTTKRLEPACRITSDTWGFALGDENDETKMPVAISGRVLAYPYRPREEYHLGDCVCSAPDGKVDIMTREEIRNWPDCIIGMVNEIPDYDEWGSDKKDNTGRDKIKVNGRIWIDIK